MWNFQSIKLIFCRLFGELYWVNKRFRNVLKLTSYIELYDLMHSLLDIDPCSPEGLLIHRICKICVYIFGGFTRCSTGYQSKSGEKQAFSSKAIMFAHTMNRCTTWHVHRWAGNVADYLQCIFRGRWNFVMSPGLFYIKQELSCG